MSAETVPLSLGIVCDHTFICCLGADCVPTPVFRAVAAWFGCLDPALAGQDQCGGQNFAHGRVVFY